MGYLEEREAKARKEYELEISAYKAKLDRVLAAIATLREEETPTVPVNKTVIRRRVRTAQHKPSPTIVFNSVAIVKEICLQMIGEYDNRAFLEKAAEKYPTVMQHSKLVRDTLGKLAKAGNCGIETVQPRHGRIPAVYRTVKSTPLEAGS